MINWLCFLQGDLPVYICRYCKRFILYAIYLHNHLKAYFNKTHRLLLSINRFNQVYVFGRNKAIETFMPKEIWLTKHNIRITSNRTCHLKKSNVRVFFHNTHILFQLYLMLGLC